MRAPRTRSSRSNHHAARRDVGSAWISIPSMFGELWRLQPTEVFNFCEAQEKRFEAINGNQFLESLDRMRLFEGPTFIEEPVSRARRGHDFGLLITRPQGAKTDWRYEELVKKLKNIHAPDLRWLLIARWLEGEGICRAEEFLPKEVLNRLLDRAKAARLPVSPTDLQYARLIRIWLPYFGRLLQDLKATQKDRRNPKEALVRMGYTRESVESAVGKKSELQAVISWLAVRKAEDNTSEINEHSLEKAYSRVKVAKDKADAKFDRWLLRHPHQVEPWEYPNFLHLIS